LGQILQQKHDARSTSWTFSFNDLNAEDGIAAFGRNWIQHHGKDEIDSGIIIIIIIIISLQQCTRLSSSSWWWRR
jgi:hypothetical protein